MKITKFGHCCLLLEESNLRILIDPGSYSTVPADTCGIEAILITHEHLDHLELNSLRSILAINISAEIFTNRGVGDILTQSQIPFKLLGHKQKVVIKDVLVEGFGQHHAVIHPAIPNVENTGFLVATKFFYPGDALSYPNNPVEVLALPIAGPWLKLSEAIDYTIKVNPKICFPVHDGMLKSPPGSLFTLSEKVLSRRGIKFIVLEEGKTAEF